MKQKKVLYIFLILLLQSGAFPQKGYYVSPGIQIGMDSQKDFFGSIQATFGYLVPELLIPIEFIDTTELTIGPKKLEW